MSTENQWLSVQDVADLLQIKSETVRRWIRRRELPVLELGGPRSAYRISRQDLNAFIWQRYRKRPKDSAGQDEGAGISRSRSTTSVTVESQPDTQTAIAATMDSHPSPAPESESHDHAEEQRFVSLLRRIPGVTYVTTVNPETGETTGRSFAFVNPEFEARLGESA